MFAKLSKLSSKELFKLSEQCSALAKDRDPDLGMDEPALPATEEDDAQGTQGNCVVQVPTGLRQPKTLSTLLDLVPDLSF